MLSYIFIFLILISVLILMVLFYMINEMYYKLEIKFAKKKAEDMVIDNKFQNLYKI